jgi:MtrB/PioB family decaheme-associated outer membrane protein
VSKRLQRRLLAGAANVILLGLTTAAYAADVPATPVVSLETPWWTTGYIEAGGRGFVNHPQNGYYPGYGGSLAKYYEYLDRRPGPFGNAVISAGSNDGVYGIDVWAFNPGYRDQEIGFNAAKVGEHYLFFDWNQIPHVYSESAHTIYDGIGSNNLFLPPGLSPLLGTVAGNTNPISPAAALNVWRILNLTSYPTDVKILRDHGTVEYRYTTPDSAWDIRSFTNLIRRQGTQVDGVVFSPNTSGAVSQVPKPVNDYTVNYGINGEYLGVSPWDKKYTLKIAYNGSQYKDEYSSYTVQNPFCPPGSTFTCDRVSAPFALMGLPPSNAANGVSGTIAADLPYSSRYMGTFSWNRMEQNQPFLPFTINPNPALVINGVQAANRAGLPAQSLNGLVNTFLINNVVTTEITPELKSKLTYRNYRFDNDTPHLFVRDWVVTDVQLATATTAEYAPVYSVPVAWVKQNGGGELNYRPWKTLNLGASYGHERYDWYYESAQRTDEDTGKVWADWKPQPWFNVRTSALFGRRTSENYNYFYNLGLNQWGTIVPGRETLATTSSVWINPDYREFYLAGRQREQYDILVNLDAFPGVRVTPSFTLRNDYYPMPNNMAAITSPAVNQPALFQEGLNYSKSTHSGIEVSYVPIPTARLFGFYMFEHFDQGLHGGNPGTQSLASTSRMYNMVVSDRIHTIKAGAEWQVIPDRFDIKGTYSRSWGHNRQSLPDLAANYVDYPDVLSALQRVEVSAKYTFEDSWIQQLGLTGKLSAKLIYAWERNNVTNWQTSTLNYVYNPLLTAGGYMTWLGYDNPNYNVHKLAAAIVYKW